MKILVTGASGLLGRAVVVKLKADGHEVIGTGLTRTSSQITKLDLTDTRAVDEFLDSTSPQAIIHTAAERRPDVVENSPEASRVLNVEVPSHIARWCKARGADCPLLINISTDYVFDGTSPPYKVDDTPNPLNAYGRSKWEGEMGVKENGLQGRAASLRVPVLYGKAESNDESAVNVLLDALTVKSSSKPKKMDANAVRYPTCVADIAKALSALCTKFADGNESIPPILHFSAMEAMTKYDMCLVMARALRANDEVAETDHLEPEYEVDPNAATSRPRHCKLDLSVIKGLGVDVECVSFETWWKEYLQEVQAEEAAAAEVLRKEEEARKKEEERRLREERAAEERRLEEKRRQEEVERLAEEEKLNKLRRQEEEEKREEERLLLKEEEEVAKQERESAEERAQEEESREQKERDAERDDEERENAKQQEEVDGKQHTTSEYPYPVATSSKSEDGSVSGHPARTFSSSTGPTSPNPSFSSLQARPTPPATSARSSPAPSILSSQAVAIPNTPREDHQSYVESTGTSLTENGGDQAEDSMNPLLSSEQATSSEHKRPASSQVTEEHGVFPSALVDTSNKSLLGIDLAAASFRGKSGGDADSDGYGEPSPRNSSLKGSQVPFAAGYGEVEYGLGSGEGSAGLREEGRDQPGKDGSSSSLPPEATSIMSSSQTHTAAPSHPTFQIRVGDPQKIGDPMTAHIVYTVRIKTNSPQFTSSQFSVLRRYNDFRWLHAALVHNNAGIFIPPVPEKVKIGRFAPDLVEARRHGLESCINKIANNAVLQLDEDFILFLESNQFQADVKNRDQVKGPVPTPEQKTYFGWSTSLTGTTYKYHESDEWFDEQKVYLDHLEAQLKNLVRVISLLAQQRKEVAGAISDFSHSLMMLSGSSLSRSLSTCFAGLGEVQRRSFELVDVQADADIRDFGSVIYEFERMVGSARKAFSTRIDAWQIWQKLEEECRKTKAKQDKVKKESQGGNQRMHDGKWNSLLEEMANVETKCLNQKREFDLIGRRCKEEMDRFEWDRIQGFEKASEIWLQGMIERNQELMAEWEQYAALLERQTGEKVQLE
ncbi:hypothetical protein CBS101457_005979 [Exobasidium rhododendri]|nr:hypothetical protein CBS101457_005979 [Exobasidium rhododendri]